MILVNAIIGVCDDVERRVDLRNQLHACGLTRIIEVSRKGEATRMYIFFEVYKTSLN